MRSKKSLSKNESTIRTKSSSNEFSVFEFNEEDALVERTSQKLLGKYRKNPNKLRTDANPVTKYDFLQCFAKGTKTRQKDLTNEPLDVDAVENVPEERIYVLDADTTSTSSNYKPLTHHCPNRIDSTSFFYGSKSYTARAQNLGVTSTGSKYIDSTLPHFLPDNTPIGIDSDDDGSTELCSSRLASSPIKGPLEVQLQDHGTGGCDINMVVLSPEHVIYGDLVSSNSQLTFSCSCIKLDGSNLYGAKEFFHFSWAVTDILSINSQWCESIETANLNLRLKSNDRNIAKSADGSGIMELKFAVHDPHWPKRQEEIKSLDVRYNDIWNVTFDIDAGRSEDVLLGKNSIFCSKHYFVKELSLDESFEEIIYPKGDPDAVSISKRDVQLLRPETFLNDTIIDFYILYLKNEVKSEDMHRFHFFNSFFFRKLADLDKDLSSACESTVAFQCVRKWTRKLNIFEKDYIFIPVNFSLHWSLIVICHPGEVVNVQDEEMENNSPKVPCILHMDSIKGSHRGLRNLIRSYLFEEWKERHNGPVEYASSKFSDLQFVPLEVPQQENSFDCGLFLLHYVELFLEQAPVDFSYSRISKSSKFLSKDWFPPAEASSKRGHIKRLIYKIVEDNSPKVSRSACDKYTSESAEADGEDAGIEFLLEIQNSSHESCSDSNVAGSPTVNCQNFGQIVPLNFFKNVVSPIEEGNEENKELSTYSPKDEASEKQVAEITEPLAMEISDEHEKGEETMSINCGSPISSNDMWTNEHSGSLAPNREEYRQVCECSSSSSDEFIGLVVEDSEEENGGDDEVIECESSPRPRRIMVEDSEDEKGGDDVIDCERSPLPRRIISSSNPHLHKFNSIEKIDLTENGMVVSMLELQVEGAKRPRITDSGERRRVMRRLSKEL